MWRSIGEQAKSLCPGSIFQAWPCIEVQDFVCMAIGNVLSGDSYHSCLSEVGALFACGERCLKFSGEICSLLTFSRLEITWLLTKETDQGNGCNGAKVATGCTSFTGLSKYTNMYPRVTLGLNGFELQASHLTFLSAKWYLFTAKPWHECINVMHWIAKRLENT